MFLLFIFDNISRLLSNQLKKYSTIILLTIYALYCPNKQNLQVVLFMALSKNFQNRFIELTDDLDEKSKSKRAKIIGISNTTYSNAYNYGIIPKTSSLIRIADYFNISIGFLIGNTETVTNEGNVEINDINFTDNIPQGVTFVENSVYVNNVNYPAYSHDVGYSMGNLSPNQSVITRFKVTVN